MKPARLFGVFFGVLCTLLLAFVYTQRSYLRFLIPAPAFAAPSPGTAKFAGSYATFSGTLRGTQFIDNDNNAYLLDPNATGNSLLVAGSVGIGTTAPARKLDIVQSSDTYAGGLGIANSAITKRLTLWVDTNNVSRIEGGGLGDSIVAINGTSTGNVGIGTTAPAQPLHVFGYKGVRLESDAAGQYGFMNSTGNLHLTQNAYYDGASWKSIAASPTLAAGFQTNVGGTEAFRIFADTSISAANEVLTLDPLMVVKTNGNVGIGTAAPDTPLHVFSPTVNGGIATFDNAATSTQSYYNFKVAGTLRGSLRIDNGGNFIIDPTGTGATYLSWDSGSNGVVFGNGSGGAVGSVSGGGNLSMNGTGYFGGNVGIGTTNPTYTLMVTGSTAGNITSGSINVLNTASTGNSGAIVNIGSNSSSGYIGAFNSTHTSIPLADRFVIAPNSIAAGLTIYASNAGQDIRFFSGSTTETMRIDSSGKVGIGTTSPGYLLDVNGSINIANSGLLRIGGNTVTNSANNRISMYYVGCGASWNSTCDSGSSGWPDYADALLSDNRLKTITKPLDNVMDKIMQLKPTYYTWNQNYDALGLPNHGQEIGFIAQDVQQLFPEMVYNAGPNDPYLHLDYQKMTAVLAQGIKEQQGEIDELKKMVEDQGQIIRQLQTEIRQLKE